MSVSTGLILFLKGKNDMRNRVLPQVEDRLRQYSSEHRGERPLYIILPADEADTFIAEVKESKGYEDAMVITEYNGSKIVSHNALKPGDIQLSNELPETSG
jgi:hypothetical protein